MGFIRGTAITLFSIILLLSLFLMNLTLIVSWSLEHDTLQPALKSSAGNFLKDSIDVKNLLGDEAKSVMPSYCLIESEYKFNYDMYNFTIPCEVIENGTDSITNYLMDSFIDTIYYAEYNCEFWECIKVSSTPFVLFSEKAMDYWRGKFLLLVLVSFALFALIFFISKNRPVTFVVTGIFIVLSSLPFRKLNWVLNLIPDEFSGIFSVFFTKAHNVFIIMLIIGLIFIGVGLAFKFFGWSMKFANSLSKDSDKEEISKSEVREIVKEELSKKNNSTKSKKKK